MDIISIYNQYITGKKTNRMCIFLLYHGLKKNKIPQQEIAGAS